MNPSAPCRPTRPLISLISFRFIRKTHFAIALIVASCCFATAAADTPRATAMGTVGPVVDVTLKTGETSQGQLLAFTEGSLSLKLENGSVVTQDAASVVSVKFLSSRPRHLSAQETELTLGELERLSALRWRDGIGKGLFREKEKEKEKAPVAPLSENDKAEYKKLRARVDVHIKALEAEIPDVTTEELAQAKIHELGRYYFFFGLSPAEIKGLMHKAELGIKNETVRLKTDANMNTLWANFTERHKNFKAFERLSEKMGGPEKSPGEGRPNQPFGPPNQNRPNGPSGPNGPQERPTVRQPSAGN